MNTLAGPFDFLDQNYPIPQHILDFTWKEVQKGTLNIDTSRNDHIRLDGHGVTIFERILNWAA